MVRRPWGPSTAVAALTMLLVACADDDPDRRFANQQRPTAGAATVPPLPAVAGPPTAAVAPLVASPATLLVARGAPKGVFFVATDRLWGVGAAALAPAPIFDPAPDQIRAVAASPSGDRVALLVARPRGDAETTSLLILAADGTVQRRADGVEAAFALPSDARLRAQSLHWSPQGDRLVAAFAGGGLLALPVADGAGTVLAGVDLAPAPRAAVWSPAGDRVAFANPATADAAADLFVVPVPPPAASPVAAPAPARLVPAVDRGRSISGVAWLPDGSAVLFAERTAPGAAAAGGNLFAVGADGRDLRVVASAGRVAPVAEVVHFAPSPDGRALAYTVSVPGPDGPTFHSLWLRPLAGGQAVPLATPPDQAVTDVWWSAAGLLFRTVPATAGETGDTGGDFALYRAVAGGPPEPLFASAAATPVASPPAGTPAGTPAASTPAAAPGAPGAPGAP